jgi:fibronectin type 3 domain-containing protein
VPFPFTPQNTPGTGLTISPLGTNDPAFNTYDYLLRTTAQGAYAMRLFGHADGAGGQVQVYIDDALRGTVELPQGSDVYSRAILVSLRPGFHTLWLVGSGTANTILPAGTGNIQIQAMGASGPPIAPSAPENLTASPVNESRITLLWASTTLASNYLVKRSTHSGGPYVTVATPATNTFTDAGLTDGTTYYYVVTAENQAGESAASPQVPATPTISAPPAAPTGVTAKADASFTLSQGSDGFLPGAEVLLRWNPTREASSYTINRTPCQTGGYTGPCPLATQLANTTRFIDIGVVFWPPDPQAGVQYTYTIQANNSFGSSANSASVTVTPSEKLPAAPMNLTATSRNGTVFLQWTPPFGMLPMFFPMQFNVYRSTTPSGPYAVAAQISTANYIDTTVSTGTTYYYVVSAVKDIGEGSQSVEVSATP